MRHPHHRRLLTLLAIAAIISAADSRASTSSAAPALTWQACSPGLVAERWIAYWGDRLECSRMFAPLEYEQPGRGAFIVGLIRIKAGSPAGREGSLFFNFGGPGANPVDFLPGMAYLWSSGNAEDPLDGDKRRLTDRFDLVAVIPRGLRGGIEYACRPVATTADTVNLHDPVVDLHIPDENASGGIWNTRVWEAFGALGADIARSCDNGWKGYLGTLQHVHDMERTRQALGERVLNFFGTSYGTWVGATYATTYPDHTGRMLLDSSMDFSDTFENQLYRQPHEREDFFAKKVVQPALAEPGYGVGNDASEVMRKFREMPHRAREAWSSEVSTPDELAAALTMSEWIRSEGETMTRARFFQLIAGRTFSQVATLDASIRDAATRLVPYFVDYPLLDPRINEGVYLATVCGDTAWRRAWGYLHWMARSSAELYPASDGGHIMAALICRRWDAGPRGAPSLQALARAPRFLIVQAEFDPATPLALATKAFEASPNSYMITARGMLGHGIFGMSATPCVEHAVGRYLLTGELPEERSTSCEFVPRSLRETRSEWPNEEDVRAELGQRLRHM